MDVRKLSSLRLAPVAVLNKHSRRGDNDGCHKNVHNIALCQGICDTLICIETTETDSNLVSDTLFYLFTCSDYC